MGSELHADAIQPGLLCCPSGSSSLPISRALILFRERQQEAHLGRVLGLCHPRPRVTGRQARLHWARHARTFCVQSAPVTSPQTTLGVSTSPTHKPHKTKADRYTSVLRSRTTIGIKKNSRERDPWVVAQLTDRPVAVQRHTRSTAPA